MSRYTDRTDASHSHDSTDRSTDCWTRRRVLGTTAAVATPTVLDRVVGDASARAASGVAAGDRTSGGDRSTASDGPTDASADGRRVVSYYTGWSRYDREFYPEDVPLEAITDLVYAFLTVREDGAVDYVDEWGDQENLAAFRELADEHPETDFHLSIGGWNDSTYFSNAAATPERRERFASTAVDLLREYEFDGVDVDWEYPGGGGAEGNVTREDDPENFALLLETVREHLDAAAAEDDAEYGLSIAASANPSVASALPFEAIEPHLDFVTVMTYDYAGSWSDVTGHNAPLYADGLSVADSMAWWAERPIPPAKLCVGLPFYGHVFEGVDAGGADAGDTDDEPGDGLGQPFEAVETVLYREIEAQYGTDDGFEQFRDETAAVPYRYDPDAGTFVSYDDAESLGRKAAFAAEEGFGGVTIWEQAGDPDGDLLATVREELAGAGEEPCPDAAGGSLTVDGQTVCDVDGDERFRDVNGDGRVGNRDVGSFFQRFHLDPYDREAFDYSGNGRVSHGDVVALFEHVVGP